MSAEIESPCTGICKLDERQVCVGCLRSIDEIVAWPSAGHVARERILQAVAERRSERKKENA